MWNFEVRYMGKGVGQLDPTFYHLCVLWHISHYHLVRYYSIDSFTLRGNSKSHWLPFTTTRIKVFGPSYQPTCFLLLHFRKRSKSMTLPTILDIVGVLKCGMLLVYPTNQDSKLNSPNPEELWGIWKVLPRTRYFFQGQFRAPGNFLSLKHAEVFQNPG